MSFRWFLITIVFLAVGCLNQPVWAKIVISNSKPVQGETIEITYSDDGVVFSDQERRDFHSRHPDIHLKDELGSSESTPTKVNFNGQDYKLFPCVSDTEAAKGTTPSYHCLIAIPADLTPGKYPIFCGHLPVGNTISVKDAKFPVNHLSLPKTKDNFITSPGEEEAVDKAKATLSDKRLWNGRFTKPSQARISAGFGIGRIVNGKLLKDYYHSGIDFAGNLGQPVKACADGKVVLAHRNYKLHGNVIALDHGQGVVTIYIHLQKILVKEGSEVHAGEKIGTVGMSGRANGPHLHLSLYVNKIAANPLPWFSKTF